MSQPGFFDRKKAAIDAFVLEVRTKVSIHLSGWCSISFKGLGYKTPASLYNVINLSFKYEHPSFRDLVRIHGTVRLRTPNDLSHEALRRPRTRFSYGIPKDPPSHHVRVSFAKTQKDSKPEQEEKVERKAPLVRFSDAYVQGMVTLAAEGKRYDLDLGPIAGMLEELLALRKKYGLEVKVTTETPGQNGSLGGLTF